MTSMKNRLSKLLQRLIVFVMLVSGSNRGFSRELGICLRRYIRLMDLAVLFIGEVDAEILNLSPSAYFLWGISWLVADILCGNFYPSGAISQQGRVPHDCPACFAQDISCDTLVIPLCSALRVNRRSRRISMISFSGSASPLSIH